MPNHYDLEFSKGENLYIRFFAKERDGFALENPANSEVVMTIALPQQGNAICEFRSSNAHIELANSTTSEFLINVEPALLSGVVEDRKHVYNIWVIDSSNTVSLQANGEIVLKSSVEYS